MPPVRVLVVDDNVLIRQLISGILSTDEDIRVVGEAGNGREAAEKVSKIKPDIVVMDIEMPVMNGLEAIERIMSTTAVPILVLSSRGDANTAYKAMTKGALEVLSKVEVDPQNPQEFIAKVKFLSKAKVISHIRGGKAGIGLAAPSLPHVPSPLPQRKLGACEVVVIAASTGGPKALSMLLPELPGDLPVPVLIAQHISVGFASGMADWLGKITQLKVKVAEEGENLSPGVVYISPSEKHMKIGDNRRILFVPPKPLDIYHPSCDILLASAADTYGKHSIGIVLTGMGTDGVEGIKRIKAAGGITLAQDEKSSAIFGMPRAAIESGCIDKVLPLRMITTEITSCIYGTLRAEY